MKCKGCEWQSKGIDINNNSVFYCLGDPKNNTEYEFLDSERIILTADHASIYRANDDDECHLWYCERFELDKGASDE